jgi:Ulp1 family protease
MATELFIDLLKSDLLCLDQNSSVLLKQDALRCIDDDSATTQSNSYKCGIYTCIK